MPTLPDLLSTAPAAPLTGGEILHMDQGSAGSVGATAEQIAEFVDQRTTELVTVCLFDASEDVAVGDGAGDQLFRIPSKLDGWDLVAVAAYHQTAGTTGTTDVQIHNLTAAADMLSTKLTVDSGETDSATAAVPAVIDAAADAVATGDKLRFDVDAVSTTAPKGLWVELQFRAP